MLLCDWDFSSIGLFLHDISSPSKPLELCYILKCFYYTLKELRINEFEATNRDQYACAHSKHELTTCYAQITPREPVTPARALLTTSYRSESH